MAPRFEDFEDFNDNAKHSRCVVLGPLLFAYPIHEKDDNTAAGPVVQPLLAKDIKPSGVEVERTPLSRP